MKSAVKALCVINFFLVLFLMISGLFSGAGVGLLILFRVNKKIKENILIVAIVLIAGVVFGLLGDLIFTAEMFV